MCRELGGLDQAIEGPLIQYRPLRWELVDTAQQRQQWRQLLDEYHYLGAPGMVGANLKYFVYGQGGQLLAALGWQSAVAHLGCRDRLLEWNEVQRARYLFRPCRQQRPFSGGAVGEGAALGFGDLE